MSQSTLRRGRDNQPSFKASEVSKRHAAALIERYDMIQKMISHDNLEDMLVHGPYVIGTGCAGAEGWGRPLKEFVAALSKSKRGGPPIPLDRLLDHAYIAEIDKKNQKWIIADDNKKSVPVFDSIMGLLQTHVNDVRTGRMVLRRTVDILQASSTCIDVAPQSPNRGKHLHCVAEILESKTGEPWSWDHPEDCWVMRLQKMTNAPRERAPPQWLS